MTATVTIRQCSVADAALLARLEQACALTPLGDTTLVRDLATPAYSYRVADQDGTAVGYLGLGVFAGEAHIITVGVLPAYRRCGIASRLLDDALAWCVAHEVTEVTLEVGASNRAATALYLARGFVAEGVRPGYYADGDDAVIMWKRGN